MIASDQMGVVPMLPNGMVPPVGLHIRAELQAGFHRQMGIMITGQYLCSAVGQGPAVLAAVGCS